MLIRHKIHLHPKTLTHTHTLPVTHSPSHSLPSSHSAHSSVWCIAWSAKTCKRQIRFVTINIMKNNQQNWQPAIVDWYLYWESKATQIILQPGWLSRAPLRITERGWQQMSKVHKLAWGRRGKFSLTIHLCLLLTYLIFIKYTILTKLNYNDYLINST